MAGSIVCWSGSASAQATARERPLVTAREDSLAQAFFLMKYEKDVAEARLDLVQKTWEARLEEERALRKKLLVTVLVSAVAAGALIYVGTLAD